MAKYTHVSIQLIKGLHKCKPVKCYGKVVGWQVYVDTGLFGCKTFIGYIWKG